MTQRQAYIAAYYFLESYWIETKSDDLVHLLSNMNPFLWTDGYSADPATYEEWLECAKKIVDGESLDARQTFDVMLEFLKFHKEEFEFAPAWLIDDVTKKTHNSSEWLACVADAMKHDD